MADKYDEAIKLLTEALDFRPAVDDAWWMPSSKPGGCLFQFCTPDGEARPAEEDEPRYGCLTTVRSADHVAWTPELTAAIRADDRVPRSLYQITPETLPIFAEWQRRLDREIRGGEVTPNTTASAD